MPPGEKAGDTLEAGPRFEGVQGSLLVEPVVLAVLFDRALPELIAQVRGQGFRVFQREGECGIRAEERDVERLERDVLGGLAQEIRS